MTNGSAAEPSSLRQSLVEKIENKLTHRGLIEGERLYLHYRLVLRDLPFDGHPNLLQDEHRAAITTLVDRASRKDLKIFSIVGHASRPGPDSYNRDLSLARAQAVKDWLLLQVGNHPGLTDAAPFQAIPVRARGEQDAAGGPVPDASELPPEEGDNPLDRRVEISYRIKVEFPQAADANVPRSRFWKIDFSVGGGSGYGNDRGRSIGVEAGAGSLTMLPDPEIGQNDTLQKTLTYESLGISIGLLSYIKKLKFLARFPLVKRLIDGLEAGIPDKEIYKHTVRLLESSGFSVDFQSEGGHFYVDEPLSFAEMVHFNFFAVSGNIAVLGAASGQLIVLHSPYLFATTVIYGTGMKVAVPDVALDFVPVAAVDVNL
ncbi:MAG: OmpA family protein [Gammaproteobacteria bacterium]|nr:OmpA family protein [Gammaproteobacteria bacterium]